LGIPGWGLGFNRLVNFGPPLILATRVLRRTGFFIQTLGFNLMFKRGIKIFQGVLYYSYLRSLYFDGTERPRFSPFHSSSGHFPLGACFPPWGGF